MKSLITENYKTYQDLAKKRSENHLPRLLVFGCSSAIFAALFDVTANCGTIVTALAVLTGFVFSAMCSDHSLADAKLAAPKDEIQLVEISRLKQLADNFQARSVYFIFISICTIFCLVGISTAPLATPNRLLPDDIFSFLDSSKISIYLSYASAAWRFLSTGVTVFLIFECLYTFYRLSETTLAIVDRRRRYLRVDRIDVSVSITDSELGKRGPDEAKRNPRLKK